MLQGPIFHYFAKFVFVVYKNICYRDLSYNFDQFVFNVYKKICYRDLSYNELTAVPAGSLTGLPYLRILQVSRTDKYVQFIPTCQFAICSGFIKNYLSPKSIQLKGWPIITLIILLSSWKLNFASI